MGQAHARGERSERRENFGEQRFELQGILGFACLIISCCVSPQMNNNEDYDDHHGRHHNGANNSEYERRHEHEHRNEHEHRHKHEHKSGATHEHNASSTAKVQDGEITVTLPCKYVRKRGNGCVLMTHGLGAKNPKVKNHENDEWLNDVIIPAVESTGSMDYCAYTARGHGDSTGWESTAEVDGDQFTWKRLGRDMLGVASDLGISSFVSAGSSQGSATALFAAMYDPARVKAVIMIRPPSAWSRKPKKKLESAEKCRERHPDEKNYLCLKGTAYSDLPSKSDSSYAAVKQKVLILTIEGDVAHPVSTANELSRLLPDSTLHVAATPEDAVRDWPGIMQTFLKSIM